MKKKRKFRTHDVVWILQPIISVEEIKDSGTNALLIANSIAGQFRGRVSFRGSNEESCSASYEKVELGV